MAFRHLFGTKQKGCQRFAMRLPSECYQMQQTVEQHMSHLRPSQVTGLVLWVYGTILARSGCQNAVTVALAAVGSYNSMRQYLREWLYDGRDRAKPCRVQLDVRACFVPLLRWVLELWQSDRLVLAIDPTMKADQINSIVISVVYRSCAIPVAWHILPANRPGQWIAPVVELVELLSSAVPTDRTVLVMCDRGLRSPRLWKQICSVGWHPYVRQSINTVFCPDGGTRLPARTLVPGPGHAYVGYGTAFRDTSKRRRGTMIVLWDTDKDEPCVVMTDLRPAEAGVCWYALRFWIELGFKALKSVGWQWQKTRRIDPRRVSRHWLVLSVATLLALAYGTRVEDADDMGRSPSHLRAPPKVLSPAASRPRRVTSVLSHGITWLSRLMLKGRLWRRVWLLPEAWPQPPPHLKIIYHPDT